jgi:ABC-type multidrug transport system fused ATPase/permease subunit
MRFYDPRQGHIMVDGRDLRTVRQRSLPSYVGGVLQGPQLFNDTIRANIACGHPEEDIRAAAVRPTQGWVGCGERNPRVADEDRGYHASLV